MDAPREPHSGLTIPPPLVTPPQCRGARGSLASRCRTPITTSSPHLLATRKPVLLELADIRPPLTGRVSSKRGGRPGRSRTAPSNSRRVSPSSRHPLGLNRDSALHLPGGNSTRPMRTFPSCASRERKRCRRSLGEAEPQPKLGWSHCPVASEAAQNVIADLRPPFIHRASPVVAHPSATHPCSCSIRVILLCSRSALRPVIGRLCSPHAVTKLVPGSHSLSLETSGRLREGHMPKERPSRLRVWVITPTAARLSPLSMSTSSSPC